MMPDARAEGLRGRRLLVVEDEYVIAMDLAGALAEAGVEVCGPVGSVDDALRLVEHEGSRLDAAVLDINLRGELIYPVAQALRDAGVPFVFASGYDGSAIDPDYADAPRCEKPLDPGMLWRALAGAIGEPR